jgi:hypothetical protein
MALPTPRSFARVVTHQRINCQPPPRGSHRYWLTKESFMNQNLGTLANYWCWLQRKFYGNHFMATLDIDVDPLTAAEHHIQLRRAVVASTIGTAIEWYDFFQHCYRPGVR